MILTTAGRSILTADGTTESEKQLWLVIFFLTVSLERVYGVDWLRLMLARSYIYGPSLELHDVSCILVSYCCFSFSQYSDAERTVRYFPQQKEF